jgi:probable phosphoglycerate mutase
VILLARHGETESNREVRFQGQLDVPLNATGRAQAAELAEQVAEEGIVALYSSPLARARETAAIVARRLGLEVREDPRFMEVDVGEWQGRLYADVIAEQPDAFAAYKAGDGFRLPGGESLEEQLERVVAGLVDVTQRRELPALVVCHGGVIRCALSHTHARGLETYHEWPVPNGALVRL